MSAGLLTAAAASLCCITPVLALIAGTSGLAATFSWLEPARPYLIGLTVTTLGIAWYQKLQSTTNADCNCTADEKPKFLQSKAFLGVVTISAGLLLFFPVYGHVLYPEQDKPAVAEDITNLEEVEFTINGMTCVGCQDHIDHEVSKLPGVFESKASYENGNAIVKFDAGKTNSAEVEEAINSTGYTVTSQKPF